MKFLVQRVLRADVEVNAECVGEIQNGFLVLIGIHQDDTRETADKMIRKLLNLRIFEDETGKTNLDLAAVNGSLLLISQFTLYADCRHGNRPSFIGAGKPDMANPLYDYIVRECKKTIPIVRQGIFGAEMKVSLVNDGPFTIMLDSDELFV